MVMPIGPLKFSCQSCSWSKVVYQGSDVIQGPSNCPACGGQLARERPSVIDRVRNVDGLLALLLGAKR